MEINTGANISGWVSDADSNEKQAAVVVDGVGSELTMNDGVVRDNYNTGANSVVGAAIQVRDGAKFVMNGGDITENGKVPNDHGGDNVINGSGVYINGAGSTFIMNGGTISNNIGYNGAGIYIKGKNKTEKPKLIINNGNISGNKLVNLEKNENLGGGIYAENAEIDIEGKNNIIDISKNGANKFSQYRSVNSFGGGLYLYNCSGNIKKVLISKNIIDGSNEQGGAGLCISNSNINIEETEIKENQSGDTN